MKGPQRPQDTHTHVERESSNVRHTCNAASAAPGNTRQKCFRGGWAGSLMARRAPPASRVCVRTAGSLGGGEAPAADVDAGIGELVDAVVAGVVEHVALARRPHRFAPAL